MKYAFIDYENIQSLDGLDLDKYERIFLFVGAGSNQTEIRLTEKFSDEINIILITVKDVAKNNLDFHLAYYLGKLDESVDKQIEFHILSKDQGYDGICHFIQHQRKSRVCLRKYHESEVLELPSTVSINKEKERVNQIFQEYVAFMRKREKKHLPVKIATLKNNIHNQTSLKNTDKNKISDVIDKIINKLAHEKLLKIRDTKVSYP